MQIIEDEHLDDVGFEDNQNTVLDVLLDDKKLKQSGIPLMGLVEQLREVTGLMPILKRVYSKQIEMEMIQHRFMAACDDNYLYKEQRDVDFGDFQNMIMKTVQERCNENLKKVHEQLSICAEEKSVVDRLKEKASIYQCGEIWKELRGL